MTNIPGNKEGKRKTRQGKHGWDLGANPTKVKSHLDFPTFISPTHVWYVTLPPLIRPQHPYLELTSVG